MYQELIYRTNKQVVSFFRNITKVLLTNDLTEDVALEAHGHGCEMIISYHPPIFAPMKSVVQRYVQLHDLCKILQYWHHLVYLSIW